jgi:hypothetical protein
MGSKSLSIGHTSSALGDADRRVTERMYNQGHSVARSRRVALALDGFLDLIADQAVEAFGLEEAQKPVKPYGDGLPVVVEDRRLELLTPCMPCRCSTN